MAWMKKALNIDAELIMQAKIASGAIPDTETIRSGLDAPVRHAAYQRLRPSVVLSPMRKTSPAPPGLMVLADTSGLDSILC